MKPRGRTNSLGGASTFRNTWYYLFVQEISPEVLFYVVYIKKKITGLPTGLSPAAIVCSAALRAASHSIAGTVCFCGPPGGEEQSCLGMNRSPAVKQCSVSNTVFPLGKMCSALGCSLSQASAWQASTAVLKPSLELASGPWRPCHPSGPGRRWDSVWVASSPGGCLVESEKVSRAAQWGTIALIEHPHPANLPGVIQAVVGPAVWALLLHDPGS